jgi:hypothetical protein
LNLTVRHVPVEYVHQVWSSVESFIEEALKFGEDDYTIDQARAYLADGSWLLLVASDEEKIIHGACAVRISNMPNYRVAFVIAIGGKLISNDDTFFQLCNILKVFGATKIQGVARDSIVRLWKRYGFKERYTLVEVEI